MYSELECGICYRTYNMGRRCPRVLRCKHSFCESCLRALPRPESRPGADTSSVCCPLCRQTTSISSQGSLRAELRVDELIMERLFTSGLLDREDEEEEEEVVDDQVPDCGDDNQGATLPDSQAEQSDSSPGIRGGRLRRSWKKVCRIISGKSSRQNHSDNCMTNEDIRNLAMMSCMMF